MKKILLLVVVGLVLLSGCVKKEISSTEEYLKTDYEQTPKIESETYTKLSDKECIDELTAITLLINGYIELGSNTIYDLNDGIITAYTFRSKLIKVSQKFDELKSIIKSHGLDVGCSTEIKNKVVYPLISVNENYALGYKKISAFSSKEDLQSATYYITKADNEKAKIESYLLSHQR